MTWGLALASCAALAAQVQTEVPPVVPGAKVVAVLAKWAANSPG
jgi:hypothetical protein